MRRIDTFFAAAVAAWLAAPLAAQTAGTSSGTLMVGSESISVTHGQAFPAARGGYRVLLVDKPLTPALVKLAVAAGADDEARLQLAAHMAEGTFRGLEVLLADDGRVTRVNIYSASSAMGMLLQGGEFEAKAPARRRSPAASSRPRRSTTTRGSESRSDTTSPLPPPSPGR